MINPDFNTARMYAVRNFNFAFNVGRIFMRKLKGTSRLAFIIGLLTFTAVSSFADDWHFEVIDESISTDAQDITIKLDSSNGVYISYQVWYKDLKLAHKDDGSWEYTTVDGDADEISMAMDSGGGFHFSYTDRWHDFLKYAHYDGSTWEYLTLEECEINYPRTSISTDPEGRPHIAYLCNENPFLTLKHAFYNGSEWVFEDVDSEFHKSGTDVSMAIDSSGFPHIIYRIYDSGEEPDFQEDTLKYAYYDGLDWNIETVYYYYHEYPPIRFALGNIAFCAITIDSVNEIHVAYPGMDGLPYALYYAHKGDSGWDNLIVDEGTIAGAHCSIAVDSLDYPRISYRFRQSQIDMLKHARWDGTGWQTEVLETSDEGHFNFTSLTIDSNDKSHISYNSGTSVGPYFVKYAHYNIIPSGFNLLQPPDGGEVSEPVTLDWEDSTNDDGDTITYDVWYATDPSFDPHDEVTELTESTYTFPEGVLTQGDTYYWKVRAWDGYDETWSGPDPYWSFTVNAPPGDFNLTAPPDGSIVTEPVVLDWEDSVDPGRMLAVRAGSSRTSVDAGRSNLTRSITYDVWYATDLSFEPHEEVTELNDSTYTFPEGTFSDGTTYCWKVRAWDGYDETWSGPDPYWSFTVEEEITDISVTHFSAESARDGIELTWECADPGVGFNLYRSEEATGMRTKSREMLNADLITGESPYVYLDNGVSDGVTYAYWLEATDLGGASETFGPATCTAGTFVPSSYALYQSRPNPARGTAVIAFDLPEDAEVTLTVYDLSGRKVTTLVNEKLPAGAYEQSVSGLAPGVYVYRLKAGEFNAVKKMVIVWSDL
jgi:hypothetical protein